ncbi:MAG: alpha-ketoacid dehydrogenase subunit beta [Elusimicrobia bacterium]|nr:alpha-ketoacid dehydrogenase subunit beta [Elusimicrobiota bacterium]
MPELNLAQSINQALHQAMKTDDRIVILGEDVGVNGGVFRITDGLQKAFGAERVIDTPLAELGIVGVSVGMAAYGLKPICEIQFDGFLPSVMDQVINHFGRLRQRSQGKHAAGLILRSPHGGMVHAPEHHSESPEAYFAHTPGIKVVIPSTPKDAKGLMLAAIQCPDPVVFFEPKRIYRSIKENVPDESYEVAIGKARVAREGKDATVISWGALVHTCLEAAQKLQGEGVDVEVIDLRTLSPIDIGAILTSVSKTGHAVIAQEAPKTCSLASEISALIHERALLKLQAPVRRVTGWDTRTPLFRLEKYYFPDAARIAAAVRETMSF